MMPSFAKLSFLRIVRATGLSRLACDERGVSAVEFAFILPLMLALYFGGVQLSQAIGIDRKVTLSARTVADLVTRVASIDSAGVNNVLNAATAVMSPYADSSNASRLMVRVSLIKIDKQSNATIEWSRAKNGNVLSGAVTVPPDLLLPETYLVLGEATYSYDPPMGHALTGTMGLNDKIYMRPRLSESVACVSC